jgi:hypothetical protein
MSRWINGCGTVVLLVTLAACSGGSDPSEDLPTPLPAQTSLPEQTVPEQTVPPTAPSAPAPVETVEQVPETTTTEAEPEPDLEDSPRSAVPKRLVGTWDGGSEGATAGRSYSFSRRGDVRYRRGASEADGTVVVKGSRMTLYLPGMKPWTYEWSISNFSVSGYDFSNLQLDGYSYVRQD